jgi:hypothetical protein
VLWFRVWDIRCDDQLVHDMESSLHSPVS